MSGQQKQGVFITVEGGDGSGKSTLIENISHWFKTRSIAHLKTREPGGSPLAESIRNLLLDQKREAPSPLAELLLFEAARAEHVAKIVRPALEQNTIVLCDRYIDSSTAFQGIARGLGIDLVESLNQIATGGLTPDITIWLKIDSETTQKRMTSRGEKSRIDNESLAFHKKVEQAFQIIADRNKNRFIVLDASCSKEEVFQELIQHPKWSRHLERKN